MAKYTPMMQQYLTIKDNYQDAFLFFRLGDFYELFFDDALKAAEELEITLTSRDGGNKRIPMCGVPYHSASTYIEKLIDRGYKVAICEQVENPSGKGVVKREVVRVITPGTIMEESMLNDQENNFLVLIAEDEASVGLIAVDLSTGECHITEQMGSLATIWDEVSTYQPKEVVLDHQLTTAEISMHQSYVFTPFSLSETKVDEELIRKQFLEYDEVCTSPSLKKVTKLLYAYLHETQKKSLGHLKRLHRYQTKQYMTLDDAARRNLELNRTLGEGKKKGSLLWLLDQTATAMGSRLLKKWLDKPLLQKEAILARQNTVAALLEDFILLDEVHDDLRRVYDLERLVARISYGSANARDLNAVKRSLGAIPVLKERLEGSSFAFLQEIGKNMDPCTDLFHFIEGAIVDDPPISIKEGNMICVGYDPQLDELRSIQTNGKSWLAELEQKEREATGIKSLKIGYNRVFGYYIEVTKSNLRLLPEGRYQRKQTLSNAERFITPELKEREQLILNAAEKSIELEHTLFVQVRDQIASEIRRLQELGEEVARLDVLHAFARVAKKFQYCRPQIHEQNELSIHAGRHPVVEAVSDIEAFVANDTELSNDQQQIYLITGPNMAGKSTYMRQVALITILAQVGSFVPATEAKISIVDRIFTRIGAADDLVGGRSTFMVEMAETCHALKAATSQSLILLDEVGRGTSTYDGMALAQAIVEFIHEEIGAKTLFSTHYHELTELECSLSRLVNVHAQCVEEDGKVVFLHRIVPGGADKSYGIHVAELAGLPVAVVERARKLLHDLEGRLSNGSNQHTGQTAQLSLFETPVEKGKNDGKQHKDLVKKVQKFDLMNQTPFEAMQFIMELQKTLK
ncbi:DNA mismatch repair protein MutS [Hazenella sp. IB182357]|uniref:DNA mismatch repair protein MutS n=1 Tax=Polycladospora coralii TaxID=2771432 RepID=A0A926N701_9BACL|nr:DNA mismatch repair protein MutS [Polycladospora coralii]